MAYTISNDYSYLVYGELGLISYWPYSISTTKWGIPYRYLLMETINIVLEYLLGWKFLKNANNCDRTCWWRRGWRWRRRCYESLRLIWWFLRSQKLAVLVPQKGKSCSWFWCYRITPHGRLRNCLSGVSARHPEMEEVGYSKSLWQKLGKKRKTKQCKSNTKYHAF